MSEVNPSRGGGSGTEDESVMKGRRGGYNVKREKERPDTPGILFSIGSRKNR